VQPPAISPQFIRTAPHPVPRSSAEIPLSPELATLLLKVPRPKEHCDFRGTNADGCFDLMKPWVVPVELSYANDTNHRHFSQPMSHCLRLGTMRANHHARKPLIPELTWPASQQTRADESGPEVSWPQNPGKCSFPDLSISAGPCRRKRLVRPADLAGPTTPLGPRMPDNCRSTTVFNVSI
jgi:hypothetical protein